MDVGCGADWTEFKGTTPRAGLNAGARCDPASVPHCGKNPARRGGLVPGGLLEACRHVHLGRNGPAVIIGVVDPGRQHDRMVLHLAIGNLIQKMGDAIEPGALLVHGIDDPPR